MVMFCVLLSRYEGKRQEENNNSKFLCIKIHQQEDNLLYIHHPY